MTHTYVAVIVAAEVDEVKWCTYPQVQAWQPHQDCILETLGEVGIRGVPCPVPILEKEHEESKDVSRFPE